MPMRSLFSTLINPAAVHLSLLLLRVAVAALMLTHGWPKLSKVLAGDMQFGDPIGLGPGPSLILVAFAEGICSLLILIGAGTRLASIPLIINFIVVFFIVHGNDPFGKRELPLLYLILYIILLIMGSGKYSVDHSLSKRSGR